MDNMDPNQISAQISDQIMKEATKQISEVKQDIERLKQEFSSHSSILPAQPTQPTQPLNYYLELFKTLYGSQAYTHTVNKYLVSPNPNPYSGQVQIATATAKAKATTPLKDIIGPPPPYKGY